MICVSCGRDLDAIGSDNCSYIPGSPLCEDCANANRDKYSNQFEDCAINGDMRVNPMTPQELALLKSEWGNERKG